MQVQTWLRVCFIVSIIFVFGALKVQAAEEGSARYDGFFVVESGSSSPYWYVTPDGSSRFGFKSSDDFSKLLARVGIGITTKNLDKIPASGLPKNQESVLLTDRFAGDILLQVEKDGAAWYVDPIDHVRYELKNGQAGFDTVKKLALDISPTHLAEIPITDALGFDKTPPDTLQIRTDEKIDPEVYTTMFEILRQQHLYKDTFSDTDLFYGSLKGMAQATNDPYTEFYPPDKNKQQQDYFIGGASVEGIGAVINARDKSLYVVSLIKGTPAEQAGLRAKDQILEINGESTAGISVDNAVAHIKGPAGTSVVLRVFRESTGATQEYTITRKKFVVPSAEGEVIDGTIAYFKISLFTADLISQFEPLVKQLITPQTQGVIVDMRDNIGGVTSASAQLADNWLTADQIIYSERRPGMETKYVASGGKTMPNVPTVILTNDETASASEIFTEALREHGQATVIGTKTYGKGTGQNLLNFADSSGLKFSTFEWLPPDGISINGKGITPDIVVTQGELGDTQLDRAKQFIKYGF